jgi:hypothetical protein
VPNGKLTRTEHSGLSALHYRRVIQMLWRTFSTECSVPVLSHAPPDKKARTYCEPVRRQ